MKFVDYIVGIITVGMILLLTIIIVGDYIIALETNRVLDPEIITLMKMGITGLIGIIGGYVGGKQSAENGTNKKENT
jgi:uncharacterized membrane protein